MAFRTHLYSLAPLSVPPLQLAQTKPHPPQNLQYISIECVTKRYIQVHEQLNIVIPTGPEMRRGHRKMWWLVVVPCTSKKSLRTESRKDIEEILKTKLATIKEEETEIMTGDENRTLVSNNLRVAKKGNKKMVGSKVELGRLFMPRLICFKDSYLVFINGVAPRGRPAGLPQP